MKKKWLLLRRKLLKRFVPEWYWPSSLLLDGATIQIRHTPYSFGTRWLLKNGEYEQEERRLLQGILQPGMQVIEMGGSIGILSAIIARAIGSGGRLVSVEASPTLSGYSGTWLEKNDWVKVINGYAFPVLQAPNLRIQQFTEEKGSLGGRLQFEISDKENNPENCWDLATICHKYKIQPQLLVADVEGSELVMAEVPISLPASIQYLLIELHPGLYPEGKEDEARIVRAIEMDGFEKREQIADVYLFVRD